MRGADSLAAFANSRAGISRTLRAVACINSIAVSLALPTKLELAQLGLMSVTALFAAGNWVWATRNEARNPEYKKL